MKEKRSPPPTKAQRVAQMSSALRDLLARTPDVITQDVLLLAYVQRQRQRELEKELAIITRVGKVHDAEILAALSNGATIEPGDLIAAVAYDTRRNVSWKTIVEERLGAAIAEQILNETEPTVTPKLIVSSTRLRRRTQGGGVLRGSKKGGHMRSTVA